MWLTKEAMKILLSILLAIIVNGNIYAQQKGDTTRLKNTSFYSYLLDANAVKAGQLLDSLNGPLSVKDQAVKHTFILRFKYGNDRSVYPEGKGEINGLVSIYKKYWRKSLLDPSGDFSAELFNELTSFFKLSNSTAPATVSDTLDKYLKNYLAARNLKTTGFGKTGKLFDLLVWRAEKDTVYKFKPGAEEISAPVVFMDGFITLGWEEYATMGVYYPGGWTTDKSLFCVKKAYNLNSEDFKISYLAHEGRHFADKTLFAGLSDADLEYRAKLTEISLANKTIFSLLNFFIKNANRESQNAHSFADYQLINSLSQKIFSTEFVHDLERWKKLNPAQINSAALQILNDDTQRLLKKYPATK